MSKINNTVLNIMDVKSIEAARIYFTKRTRACKIKHDIARFFFFCVKCLYVQFENILILNIVGKHP